MHPLIQALLRPAAYDHPVRRFEVLETHISWVILTGDYAYKLKKPVDLGFANFTTLDRRRFFCEEEIRLNRRLAPQIYLGVRPVVGPAAAPSFHAQGQPIDYAVQMKQFSQHDLLPAVLARQALSTAHLDRLALDVAAFHRAAPIVAAAAPYATPDAIRKPMQDNLAVLDQIADFDQVISSLRDWSNGEFDRLRGWFAGRRAEQRVRECHGDMHLGNMVLLDGSICVFDCLEFNAALRWIDVMAEVAFLVMDLQERGRPDFAFYWLNRWLEQTGDYQGLTGWRWYFAYRALVRAKVAALRLKQPGLASTELAGHREELASYLELAAACTRPRPVALIITRGVSLSGKSHVASRVCQDIQGVQLRSDVERKRLFGQWGDPGSRLLTGDMYTPQVTDLVYRDAMLNLARLVIAAGFPVVVDATFLRRSQRSLFEDLAVQLAVPYRILDVRARPETLKRRLESRLRTTTEPSDANHAIVRKQLAQAEPLTAGEQALTWVVDTDSSDWQASLTALLRSYLHLS